MANYIHLPAFTANQIETVPNVASLPSTGVVEGAIRYVEDIDELWLYDGTVWFPAGTTPGTVTTVNGQSGVVVLDSDDIPEGSSNLYFTDERAQDAVGTVLTDTASVDFTYNDAGNTISAAVLPAGVDKNALGGSALTIANGGTGQTTAVAAFNGLSPLTTRGDLLTNDGTDDVRLAISGSANKFLHSNGTDPSWQAVSLTADVSGTLPVANGGTGQTTALAAFNALSPLTTRGDILTNDGTNDVRLAISGSANKFLHSNGTDPSWQAVSLTADVSGTLPIANGGTGQTTQALANSALSADPTLTSTQYEEWISSTAAGVLGWTTATSGAGAAAASSGTGVEFVNRAEGVVALSTGTTLTGRAAVHLGANMGFTYAAVAQKWRVWIGTLSVVTDEYAAIFGLGDTPTGAGVTQTNEASFVYDRTVSVNWLCRTTAAGVTTTTTTTTAVSATTFTNLAIEVNAAGTSVVFKVNGATVATNTTNIPGFLQDVGPIAKIAKSLGTTSIALYLDYFWQRIDWASAR